MRALPAEGLPPSWRPRLGGTALRALAFSAFLHGAFLALAYLAVPTMEPTSLDRFEDAERIVSMVIADREPEAPEAPEVTTTSHDAGRAPRQGEADGSEAPEAPDARGTASDAPDDAAPMTDAMARAEAGERGVVGVLSATPPGSLFGSSGDELETMMAIGAATDGPALAYGARGLGRYGGGLGGPPRGADGFGSGPIRVGSPTGRGEGRELVAQITEHDETPIGTVGDHFGDAEIEGCLDRDLIHRVVREHRREIRACYNDTLRQHPDAAGRVTVRFIIDPTGRVPSVQITASDIADPALGACMSRRISRWRFPEGPGLIRVAYPFVFST